MPMTEDVIKKIADDTGISVGELTISGLLAFLREKRRNVMMDRLEVLDRYIVSSGEEAVKESFENKPDLILMDINLKGMNGIEAAKKIKKLSIPIIFISGSNYENSLKTVARTSESDLVKVSSNCRFVLVSPLGKSQDQCLRCVAAVITRIIVKTPIPHDFRVVVCGKAIATLTRAMNKVGVKHRASSRDGYREFGTCPALFSGLLQV